MVQSFWLICYSMGAEPTVKAPAIHHGLRQRQIVIKVPNLEFRPIMLYRKTAAKIKGGLISARYTLPIRGQIKQPLTETSIHMT